MGRDGDGDGVVEKQGYFIIAFMAWGWLVFLGNAVRFISSRFLCFVLCLKSSPLC